MAFDDCIVRVAKFMEGTMNKTEVQTIVRDLERLAQSEVAADPSKSFALALNEKASEILAEMERAKRIEHRNRLLDEKSRTERRTRVNGMIAEGLSAREALSAIIGGTHKDVAGARFSVEAQQHAYAEGKFLGPMAAEMEAEGLSKVFSTGALDRQVAQELYAAAGGDDAVPGVSGSKEARRVAEIIHKYQKKAVELQNRAGADIRELRGYITRQAHDQYKIKKAGLEKWKAYVKPRLREKETFTGSNPDEFLNAVYDNLVTGEHLKSRAAEADRLSGFKGPRNIAKSVSQERTLHFKSADDWYDYNQQFGRGSIRESVVFGLDRAGSNIALMENFGTNPRAQFEADVAHYKEKFKHNEQELTGLTGKYLTTQDSKGGRVARMLMAEFDNLDGSARIAANPRTATGARMFRMHQNLIALGGVVISSISDIAIQAQQSHKIFGKHLNAYGGAMGRIAKPFKTAERKQLGMHMGAGIDGWTGAMTSRWNAQDSAIGKLSKAERLFFRLNLLEQWTDLHKEGFGMMMANIMAAQAGKRHDRLDEPLRNALRRAEISPKEWEVLRMGKASVADGRDYLMSDSMHFLPDEAFAPLIEGGVTPAKAEKVRATLETKLSAFYFDNINQAVLTPGVREQAITNLGFRPGTPEGEAIRFFMQFKSFGIAMWRNHFKPSFAQAARGDILPLAHLMVMTTGLGYVAMNAKMLAAGKEPRVIDEDSDAGDVRDVFMAAFLQGGGAGIYGDFLFGETSRFSGGLLATVAGPVASNVTEIIDRAKEKPGRLMDGKEMFTASDIRTLYKQIPGNNLFYTRAGMDYLFVYSLQEQVSPGYLRRAEKRIQKEQGTRFMFPPTRHRAKTFE